MWKEFTYPKDVAYPIGGEGTPRYVVLEVHYDNPAEDSGELLYLHIIITIAASYGYIR